MKNVGRSIGAVLAVIIFAFICVAAILYARGVFDISFIDRNAGTKDTEENSYDTLPPLETGPAPEYENIEDMGAPETVGAGTVKFENSADLLAGGSTIDTSVYSAEKHTLALVNPALTLPNVYSYRQMWDEVNVKKEGDNGGYIGATEFVLRDRTVITLYAGYIIYDCGGTMYLLDNVGNPLVTFNDGDIKPAYHYNAYGEPLFLYNGRYCHYDDVNKLMSEEDVTYIHEVDSIGVYFEHAPEYGRGMGETRFRNDTNWKWSFINSNNPDIYKYYGLYNFSESLAAAMELRIREVTREGVELEVTDDNGFPVIDENGDVKTGTATVVTYEKNYQLNFLDTAGKTKLSGDKTFVDGDGNIVFSTWQKPLFTHGKEAMGYLYFENGLCRVREITTDLTSPEKKIYSDTDYIIKNDGSRFPLPEGYTVVSYSCGMILFEKDGKYGFMNYNGEWVVQPVYSYAEPYFEGLAVIGLENGKKAMIDTAGNTVIPFAYQYISNASSGVIALYDSETGWQIVHKMTKLASAPAAE